VEYGLGLEKEIKESKEINDSCFSLLSSKSSARKPSFLPPYTCYTSPL
jgi:hypothetical protein